MTEEEFQHHIGRPKGSVNEDKVLKESRFQFDDSAPRHLRHPSRFFTVLPKEAKNA